MLIQILLVPTIQAFQTVDFPFLMVLYVFLWSLLPLDILSRGTRYTFLRVILSVIMAPAGNVKFVDAFVGDILTRLYFCLRIEIPLNPPLAWLELFLTLNIPCVSIWMAIIFIHRGNVVQRFHIVLYWSIFSFQLFRRHSFSWLFRGCLCSGVSCSVSVITKSTRIVIKYILFFFAYIQLTNEIQLANAFKYMLALFTVLFNAWNGNLQVNFEYE